MAAATELRCRVQFGKLGCVWRLGIFDLRSTNPGRVHEMRGVADDTWLQADDLVAEAAVHALVRAVGALFAGRSLTRHGGAGSVALLAERSDLAVGGLLGFVEFGEVDGVAQSLRVHARLPVFHQGAMTAAGGRGLECFGIHASRFDRNTRPERRHCAGEHDRGCGESEYEGSYDAHGFLLLPTSDMVPQSGMSASSIDDCHER